jgi:tRNA1Val (adenine37-N6)-methyltransferase
MDQSPNRFFKGWAKPGRLLDPSRPKPEAEEGETLDAISGDFRIFQLRDGHRFSTDDVLVAWYGTSLGASVSRVLDLGSGIGSVGMIAAWRLPLAQFVTIEAQDISVRLARKSAQFNQITDRYDIRHGDFRTPGILLDSQGVEEKFDLVLGSPPYFPEDAGVHGDHPQKVACRFETRGDVAHYCEMAAKHLAPGAVFAFVFPIQPAHQLERVRNAVQNSGLALLRWRPICLKEGEPSLLGVFAAVKATDLPEKFREKLTGADGLPSGIQEPALTIRRKDGTVDPEYSVVKLSIGFPP